MYDTVPLEAVAGRCVVLPHDVWCKGRPTIPLFEVRRGIPLFFRFSITAQCFFNLWGISISQVLIFRTLNMSFLTFFCKLRFFVSSFKFSACLTISGCRRPFLWIRDFFKTAYCPQTELWQPVFGESEQICVSHFPETAEDFQIVAGMFSKVSAKVEWVIYC